MFINSQGGFITAGMAIYDTMQYVKCDISTIAIGMAASMGSVLLAGGTPGKRFALANSTILIHQPLGGAEGQATEIEIAARQITKQREIIYKMLAKFSGNSLAKIKKDADRDKYFTADEAKEYGLIDKVLK